MSLFECKLRSYNKFGEGRTSPTPPSAAGFAKLPVAAAEWITGRIADGVRVPRGSRTIRYTQTTINVLRAIIQRMDRTRNVAQISYAELMALTGIKSRSTLSDHLFLLESHAGFIAIDRQRAGKTRNKINVFRLIGAVADCVLDSLSPKKRQKSDTHSPMIGLESDMDGWMEILSPILSTCGIEKPVLKRLIQEHGERRVADCVTWAQGQTWAHNPAALAVTKIRDVGFDPRWTSVTSRTEANDYIGGKYAGLIEY